jgi:hypothetical protein
MKFRIAGVRERLKTVEEYEKRKKREREKVQYMNMEIGDKDISPSK